MTETEAGPPPKAMRWVILAASLGCSIEFYDFIIFAFFAVQIGQSFFPSNDRYASLMGALATFAAGFLSRPLGAYVLGGYADRAGRRPAMLLSMVLMGLAIAALALTPSYSVIGLAAPIVAVAARLVQGFALGGEIGSSTVYMVEAGGSGRRGWNAGMQGAAQYAAAALGALVGVGLSSALSEVQLATFGWRIALLLSATVVPFALVIRRALPETMGRPEPARPRRAVAGPNFTQVVWLGGLIMASSTIGAYIFAYTATFGETQLHLSTRASMEGQTAASAVGVVASLAGGWLCDRWGRRALMIWPQLAFALLTVPCFAWLLAYRTVASLVSTNLLLGGLSAITASALYAAVIESLAPLQRSRAFALIYAVPIAVFGGTTQLFVTWLMRVTGTPMSLAWFLTAVNLVGLAAMMLLPESAPGRWAPMKTSEVSQA